jgi:hypothetical protein
MAVVAGKGGRGKRRRIYTYPSITLQLKLNKNRTYKRKKPSLQVIYLRRRDLEI